AGHVSQMAIYAIILGVDIGPKLTPFGSLATLLWLGALKRNGISISWGHFIRENWWVTLLTLAAAFGALALVSLALL
ncbi:MAG: ArsB/NhaD family transporter, partial [Ktedonobacterales bacterium]